MKIVHCCLSCFYIDNFNYQENLLPRQNKKDGNDVYIIASTETFLPASTSLSYVSPCEYINEDGIPVKRIPYRLSFYPFLSRKIRAYKGLYSILENINPDLIFFHGLAAYEIITVSKYKKNHPTVRFYADSHEDFNNSGRNFLSLNVLAKILYRSFYQIAQSKIDKVFYISAETRIFDIEVFRTKENILEYLPLGGIIIDKYEAKTIRAKYRKGLSINDDEILFVHSGKMDKGKKTFDLVSSFNKVKNDKIKLLIIGEFANNVYEEVKQIIETDRRVVFLGWKDAAELINYLYAADVYIQPGSQSATLQNAICAGCAVAVYPHKSYKLLLGDSAFYISDNKDIIAILNNIVSSPNSLEIKKKECWDVARKILDYKVLASKLY